MTEDPDKDNTKAIEYKYLTPLPSAHSYSFPISMPPDPYPLSPIRFEESRLDKLWDDVPSEPESRQEEVLSKLQPLATLRSKNGLKGLSWKIKDIVDSLGTSSYKEVADELLTTLEIPQSSSPLKDEKNIRRRVYDALNVLVAADIIKKQGKKVMPAWISASNSSRGQNVEDPLFEKREFLRKLARSYAALKTLFERNSMHGKLTETVRYPLAVVSVPTGGSYKLSLAKGSREVNAEIEVSGEFEVIRDAEILRKIGLQQKLTDIPQELKSLCGHL